MKVPSGGVMVHLDTTKSRLDQLMKEKYLKNYREPIFESWLLGKLALSSLSVVPCYCFQIAQHSKLCYLLYYCFWSTITANNSSWIYRIQHIQVLCLTWCFTFIICFYWQQIFCCKIKTNVKKNFFFFWSN